jgi:transposase
MAAIEKKTRRYPTDLTDEEWSQVEGFCRSPGRPAVAGVLICADSAYDRGKLMDKAAYLDFVIEVLRRIEGQPGFNVLPRRWVVERTFGWMTRWRRLVRDYEARIDVSEAMIHVAMGGLLLRRISH